MMEDLRHTINFKFNLHYYSALNCIFNNTRSIDEIKQAYHYFSLKEPKYVMIQVLDTAARAAMLPKEYIFDLMCGKESNIISNKTDLDKMGLMLGYVRRVYNMSFEELEKLT